MNLYRVIFAGDGGLTEPRTVHGANGHCGARTLARDTCPAVRGHVTEVWLPARGPVEAASTALMRYPGTGISEVLRGLSPRQANAADACAAYSRLEPGDRSTVRRLMRQVDHPARMERFA